MGRYWFNVFSKASLFEDIGLFTKRSFDVNPDLVRNKPFPLLFFEIAGTDASLFFFFEGKERPHSRTVLVVLKSNPKQSRQLNSHEIQTQSKALSAAPQHPMCTGLFAQA